MDGFSTRIGAELLFREPVDWSANSEETMRKKNLLVLCLVTLIGLSGTALGQLKYGTDFTTSDSVALVTHVKVASNMIPYYLEGIRQTWVTGNEVSKELGHIQDYAIYANELADSGHYNLTLVVMFEDMAQYEKGRKEFKEFEAAWLEKISESKREEIVKTYPEMRKIVGEYLSRKLEFK
jgi:hypothetical protein